MTTDWLNKLIEKHGLESTMKKGGTGCGGMHGCNDRQYDESMSDCQECMNDYDNAMSDYQ